MAREFAKTFYSSKAWQTCRNEYAKRVGKLYRVAIPNTSREMYADFYERAVDEGALD